MARGIVFDEDAAREIERRLRTDGYAATVSRERFAGEDDDEDHPWAVETDAPSVVIDLLLEAHDGWLEEDGPADGPTDGPTDGTGSGPTPWQLPDAPRRRRD